ncbi:MAG: DUF2194 domain-containing protein, partial [Calditrichaeota bacterium]|nr:DUF2194 domain-containing protein [Calditrichota bacterium]
MTAKPPKRHAPVLDRWTAVLLTFAALLAFAGQTRSATPVKRDILALYKSSEHRSEENCEIHELLELPLNFLGFRVTYADAESHLPGPREMERYRAIVTWFQAEGMRGASRYRRWLLNQLDAGKRVIILGNFGASAELGSESTTQDVRDVKRVFARLGVVCEPDRWIPKNNLRFLWRDPKLAAFERDLAKASPPGLMPVFTRNPRVKPVATYRAVGSSGQPILGAFISPRGGYVASGLAYVQLPGSEDDFKTQWYIDPVRFLSEALD